VATHIRPYAPGLAALREHIVRVHDALVDEIEEDAVIGAPWRTGELALSIHTRKIRPLLSHVVVDTDHWQPMEYGASPHVIRPIPPNTELFWPGATHPVREVHHPGNAARPFMRPAVYQRRRLRGRIRP
jgi:hypothetical protein